MAYNHIEPGREIEITSRVYFSREQTGLAELVELPIEKLEEMKQFSIGEEKVIYDRLCAATDEWAKQATNTLRLMKAMEYLQTPAVTHTSNVWVEDEYGRHEISNMVYTMSWRVYEKTEWNKVAKKSISVAWELSWSVYFNTPHNPDDSRSGSHFAGQERKRFTDKAEMEKYLQGRIAAYAHLFTQLSPPIPEEHRGRFCINGELLPGYTVEAHTPTVTELLELLDDEDMSVQEIPSHAKTTPQTPDTPPQKSRPCR